MSISIQTNVSSLLAQDNLRVTNEFQNQTIGRLTSGFRINSSGDDAAGLAVANKFRSAIAELTQGVRNANDGISALQIVDGGLNNIAKMLDRLKTLATQSASTTFTGDRNTLDTEYQAMLGEITRQAGNIGLASSGSADATRYNSNIAVYIGGGSSQSNAQINIDLSAPSNRVDSVGLALNTTNVQGSSSGVVVGNAALNGATAFLAAGSQQFTAYLANGQSFTATVVGGPTGTTGSDVLAQLNAQLGGYGITASMDPTNKYLQFSGTTGFTMTAVAATAGTGVAAAGTTVNSTLYNTAEVTVAAGGADGVQVFTFTPTGGSAKTLSLTGAETVQQIFDKAYSALSGSEISVIRDGNKVSFQSATAFTIARDATASTGGLAALAAAGGSATVVAPSGTSNSATGNALNALTAIGVALQSLGLVQGRVGAGENKLQYAIKLAQSQNSNYSAAESRIRDADVAAEAANLTKAQVLTQASLAAMAQANSTPQAVLALLRG